jgi:hypothetical protein
LTGSGKILIHGKIFAASQTIPAQRASKLLLTLGNRAADDPSMQMKVNGRQLTVPPSATSIGFLLGPTGYRPLPVSKQPPGARSRQSTESPARAGLPPGAAILAGSAFPVLSFGEQVALTHHERWDGSGYPSRLCGEAFHLAGRIVAVVDVFDAPTPARTNQPGRSRRPCPKSSMAAERSSTRASSPPSGSPRRRRPRPPRRRRTTHGADPSGLTAL